MSNSESIYTLDGIVPLKKAIPFGLQHILAMFVSNATPVIILAGICAGDLTAVLIQNAMIIAGIGTIVQLYPVWRVGSRLPIVMGISFTFLSLAIAIGTAQAWERSWVPSSSAVSLKDYSDCSRNTGSG